MHFLCFMSDINILRKLFKKNGELHLTAHWYRRLWSKSQTTYFTHICWIIFRVLKVYRKYVEIRGVYCTLLNFALCKKCCISSRTRDRYIWLSVLWIFWLSMQHCWEIATVRVENEWLRIRAVSRVFIYLDLMRNRPFSTLPLAISQQCCIDNQNIHSTNNHMCLSCVRDDMLNF